MAEIQMKNIVKTYGDGFPAVNDVSIDVEDGEFVILVGPSGCGKSTLLRMIVGLEDITSGDMVIGGERVNDKAPRERNLAMVFQNYALYPHLTVYENIAFPLRLSKKFSSEEIDQKVRQASKTLELDEHLERKPGNLSGGQRQRVAMGRAIVRDPQVFLFDEPLSNLDAKLRAQMRIEIKRLHAQLPTTSVFVTHDQVEAMTLGDRVVVMRDGRVQQAGTPLAVYGNPVNKFVAGFIGAPAMNFLDVTIRQEGATLVAQSPSVKLAVTEPGSRALEAWQGKRVILGLRPEHLALGDGVLSRSFAARVEVVEQLGSEILLETRVGETRVTVARVAPEAQIAAGDQIRLSVQPGRLHFFDPETEAVIAG